MKGVSKRTGAVCVALLTVMLAAVGCGNNADRAENTGSQKKVVLNEVAHSIFYAPMYVAIEEGYFEEITTTPGKQGCCI